MYRFARKYLRWLILLFIPCRFSGAGAMPETGRVVVCCNHLSLSDPLRLAFSQRRQIFFMSKAELFQNKALGFLLSRLGAFPVRRGSGDTGAIHRASEILQNGKPLGIFLEGTRSRTGKLLQPKAGAVMLAYQNRAPILPCCITAPGGGLPKLFRTCTVSYGKLIPPEELGIQNGTGAEFRRASRLVMERIASLRERDLKLQMGSES